MRIQSTPQNAMNAETTAAGVVAQAQTRAARRQPTEQQRVFAETLEQRGYGFVSLDPDDAVPIIFSRGAGSCPSSLGLVFQPLLHQLPTLLAYGFCQLGLDALIIVAPDPASLERLAPLLRDHTPADWKGKVGVVTASALELLFSRHPEAGQFPAQDLKKHL
jgi:hypothetical protein